MKKKKISEEDFQIIKQLNNFFRKYISPFERTHGCGGYALDCYDIFERKEELIKILKRGKE